MRSLLVNGVFTASNHANRDLCSNCDIDVTCADVNISQETTLLLVTCFGIELLCGLYLTRCDLIKGQLFNTGTVPFCIIV